MGSRGLLGMMLATGLGVGLLPSRAEACACCGSEESVAVVGWKRDGKAAVVHHEIHETCNTSEYYAVWKVGAERPAYCFSAYAEDPTEAIACDEVGGTDPNGPLPDEPKPLRLPDGFEPTARSMPASQIILWVEDDEDSDTGVVLSLAVFVAGSFTSLQFPDSLVPDFFGDENEVSLWPAPRGRHALALTVAYAGDEEESRVAWVRLPGRVDRTALVDGAQWVLPLARPRLPDSESAASVGRRLAMARVYARAGKLERALGLASGAVNSDPGNAASWVEYAGYLLQAKQPHQAAEVLRKVVALGSAESSAHVVEALGSPAFEALRGAPGLPKVGPR